MGRFEGSELVTVVLPVVAMKLLQRAPSFVSLSFPFQSKDSLAFPESRSLKTISEFLLSNVFINALEELI